MNAPVSLLTDRYELTMLSSLLEDGLAHRPAVFETFARRLPAGRRYGVMAGLGRLTPMIRDFTFNEEEIAWLVREHVITPKTADYLADFRFHGNIDAYQEGEIYFPYSPLLTVTGELGECIILETLILSVLNYDCAVAAAAARMSVAAGSHPLIEMGSRRVHEQAAVAAARAAYLAGFTNTSNLAAGFTYGIPTVGTAAHAFTLSYPTEKQAFTAQVAAHGVGTSLLVDTYDIEQGIRNAVEVAGTELGAIRLDSGDPAVEAKRARALLDSLGAVNTRIVSTGDLDEYLITALQDAPIDTFGVGTRVSTGSGHPAAGLVYKLVAVGETDSEDTVMRPVAKKSSGKISIGGRKNAVRLYDENLKMTAERLVSDEHPLVTEAYHQRKLQHRCIENGEIVANPALKALRTFHMQQRADLPAEALLIADGEAAFTASFGEEV